MKIDRPTPIVTSNIKVGWALAQQKSPFDNLVEPEPSRPDTRQADEYYWQHQHQLQQSEITFNPIARDIESPITTNDNSEKESINTPSTEIDITPLLSFRFTLDETPTFKTVTLSKLDIQKITTLNNTELTTEPRPSVSGNLIKTPLPNGRGPDKSSQIPAPLSIVKHYQLFVDDKQVELTLNTTHLSKQNIIELKAYIHQWLNQKGYTLKKLVLNGEQQ